MSKYTHRDSLQNEILICNEDKIKKKKLSQKKQRYIYKVHTEIHNMNKTTCSYQKKDL